MKEQEIEQELIDKLSDLKYTYRGDIKDRASLERNFREKFEELNRARLTDGEFGRLMEEIVTADVYAASQVLRETNTFEREDGTPLHYTLINTKDWCKNTFEAVNQLRVNTDYSHHVYDVVLLINGVPVVQIELKASQVNPRRAMEQIVDYKKDPGNGYGKTPMCFPTAFYRQQPRRHMVFRQQQQPSFPFRCRRGLFAVLPIRRQGQQQGRAP